MTDPVAKVRHRRPGKGPPWKRKKKQYEVVKLYNPGDPPECEYCQERVGKLWKKGTISVPLHKGCTCRLTKPYWVSKKVYEGKKGPPTKKFGGEMKADTFASIRNFALSYYLQGMIKEVILDEVRGTLPYIGDDVMERLAAEIDKWDLYGPPEVEMRGDTKVGKVEARASGERVAETSARRQVVGQEEVGLETEETPESIEHKCEVCGRPMNPAEWMLGPVCGECARKKQEEVTGQVEVIPSTEEKVEEGREELEQQLEEVQETLEEKEEAVEEAAEEAEDEAGKGAVEEAEVALEVAEEVVEEAVEAVEEAETRTEIDQAEEIVEEAEEAVQEITAQEAMKWRLYHAFDCDSEMGFNNGTHLPGEYDSEDEARKAAEQHLGSGGEWQNTDPDAYEVITGYYDGETGAFLSEEEYDSDNPAHGYKYEYVSVEPIHEPASVARRAQMNEYAVILHLGDGYWAEFNVLARDETHAVDVAFEKLTANMGNFDLPTDVTGHRVELIREGKVAQPVVAQVTKEEQMKVVSEPGWKLYQGTGCSSSPAHAGCASEGDTDLQFMDLDEARLEAEALVGGGGDWLGDNTYELKTGHFDKEGNPITEQEYSAGMAQTPDPGYYYMFDFVRLEPATEPPFVARAAQEEGAAEVVEEAVEEAVEEVEEVLEEVVEEVEEAVEQAEEVVEEAAEEVSGVETPAEIEQAEEVVEEAVEAVEAVEDITARRMTIGQPETVEEAEEALEEAEAEEEVAEEELAEAEEEVAEAETPAEEEAAEEAVEEAEEVVEEAEETVEEAEEELEGVQAEVSLVAEMKEVDEMIVARDVRRAQEYPSEEVAIPFPSEIQREKGYDLEVGSKLLDESTSRVAVIVRFEGDQVVLSWPDETETTVSLIDLENEIDAGTVFIQAGKIAKEAQEETLSDEALLAKIKEVIVELGGDMPDEERKPLLRLLYDELVPEAKARGLEVWDHMKEAQHGDLGGLSDERLAELVEEYTEAKDELETLALTPGELDPRLQELIGTYEQQLGELAEEIEKRKGVETPFQATRRIAALDTGTKSEEAAKIIADEFRRKKDEGKKDRPFKPGRPTRIKRTGTKDDRLTE